MNSVHELGKIIEAVAADKEITIKATAKQKVTYPPYMVVGNGRYSKRYGVMSMDIIDVCAQLNTSENKVLQFFKNCFVDNSINGEENPNTVVPTGWKEFDSYLKKALEKNYTHLEYIGVLKRVKRGVYMVNPYLFMPRKEVLVSTTEKWKDIDGYIPTPKDEVIDD